MSRKSGNRFSDQGHAPTESTAWLGQVLERGFHDLGEARRRRQTGERRRVEPMRLTQLLVQDRFPASPMRGEAQDHEVPFHPVVAVAGDGLAEAGKPDRLDLE